MRNLMMTISYDGTDYIGWQRQSPDKGVSIQGVLEKALKRLLQEEITVSGAGRTDAGVHAWGQKAAFQTEKGIPVMQLAGALNRLLPPDVVVRDAVEMPQAFHVRFDAQGKAYRYTFLCGEQDVFHCRYGYFLEQPVDFDLMRQGAALFCGDHYFRAFTANNHRVVSSYIRNIKVCQFRKIELANPLLPEMAPCPGYVLDVAGDGFLYKMVRLIAGSLLALGQGKITLADISRALVDGEKIVAPPLPACGLTLVDVNYAPTCGNNP